MQGLEQVGRALWLAERRRGIGGTDAAAILGVSPFATGFDVWCEKTGLAPEKEQTEQMWWGAALEDLVARRYTEATGLHVWNPGQVMAHPEVPYLIGTPDRVVIGGKRGVEIKTASPWNADQWGREGSTVVPPAYAVQCYHYMLVTGLKLWDIAVLIGGSDFRRYTLRHDPEFEAYLLEQLTWWWDRHVVGGVRPEVTGARSTSEMLGRIYVEDEQPCIIASEDDLELMAGLANAKAAVKQHEKMAAEFENKLKVRIEDHGGIEGERHTVRWTGGKPTKSTDWQALALKALDDLESARANELLKEFTTEARSPRRFTIRTHRREA